MYVDFFAFRDVEMLHPLGKIIFKSSICNNETNQNPTHKPSTCNLDDGWYKLTPANSNHSEWVWMDNGTAFYETMDTMNDSAVCTCTKTYNFVNMLGSSHMRYNMDYISSSCTSLLGMERKHGRLRLGKVKYLYAGFLSDHLIDLNRLVIYAKSDSEKNLHLTGLRNVLIFQFGAWDLGRMYTKHPESGHRYLLKNIPKLAKALEKLSKSSPSWSTAKIIWITPMPYPDRSDMSGRQFRNNHILPAAICAFREATSHLNIEVLDAFSMINPRNDEDVCSGHYLCRVYPENHNRTTHPGVFIGDMGKILMMRLLHRICDWTPEPVHFKEICNK